ncbi:GSCFA domain-containing protein [Neorhizobium sp. AL 9.2.2]|uniref:GSCFA domain-containing protein n=1 Tax=Neorhizobium sp. AL 9.2.2 TaxID=2712894 RepID=UPI00157438A3|nr:GSCFA domain-containing protein [Neorhizobium sp. AL 9.2.2]NSY19766.1 GSCFA domain-containing protein [Neorhizobium sp. AL 9.2.2]
MTIAIIGHCQASSLAQLLGVIARRDDIRAISAKDLSGQAAEDTAKTLERDEQIIVLSTWRKAVEALINPRFHARITVAPTVYFTGYHPDFVYAKGGAVSPLGNPLSALALYGFREGFSVEETVSLFRDEVFEHLGYYDHWAASVAALQQEGRKTGISLDAMLTQWMALGCFVYTPNHPVLPVMIDIAVAMAEKMSLDIYLRRPHRLVADPFVSGPVFPVFPEVARRHGIDGDYLFRVPIRNMDLSPWKATFDLPAFVARFYKQNETVDRSAIECKRFDDVRYARLADFRQKPGARAKSRHPYRGLPSHQFWKNAVSQVAIPDMDPVAGRSFEIRKDQKVAAAGSCFAQHVTKRLEREGFNYLVVEDGGGLDPGEAVRRNYRVYSARYGNLYTARQLLQLFDRSEGKLVPHDSAWARGDHFVDPFRPEFEPDGFASIEELEAERDRHFAALRRMWRELDVFIFTLGLTETWRSKTDGCVFPLAPGVSGGAMNESLYEFYNLDTQDVIGDLIAFAERLKSVNPNARIILTVSPVPLVATYEKRHVLVSNAYSKSVLRVAADAVSRLRDDVEYFPSYEIITGSYNNGLYFEADKRNVTSAGVDHVMGVFLRHYQSAPSPSAPSPLAASVASLSALPVIAREIIDGQGVICEEELLHAGD